MLVRDFVWNDLESTADLMGDLGYSTSVDAQQGATGIYLTSGFKRPERKHAHEFYRYIGYEKTGYRFVKRL